MCWSSPFAIGITLPQAGTPSALLNSQPLGLTLFSYEGLRVQICSRCSESLKSCGKSWIRPEDPSTVSGGKGLLLSSMLGWQGMGAEGWGSIAHAMVMDALWDGDSQQSGQWDGLHFPHTRKQRECQPNKHNATLLSFFLYCFESL